MLVLILLLLLLMLLLLLLMLILLLLLLLLMLLFQVGESSRSSEVEAFLERCGEEPFAPNLHRECR